MSLSNMKDLLERHGYQRVFKSKLLEGLEIVEGFNSSYNINYAIDEDKLFTFLQTTQPIEFNKVCIKADFKSKFVKYIREQITSYGLISVLRNPVKFNGAHFKMFIAKPHNSLNPDELIKYKNNIVSVTEELVYNNEVGTGKGGRGDLTIFVNGLPLIWIELKSNAAGQNIVDARRQYIKDRSPSELIFRYKQGCLVYFAMDTEEVEFSTKLKKDETKFMPYNKGVGMHKGNPDLQDDFKTSYMWTDILTKDNILEWVENYFVNEIKISKDFKGNKTKSDNIIFPRFHQFNEINKILSDIQTKGIIGQNYLIMDSPGSGKTYSISWLAHRLACLHDSLNNTVYDAVIVITDRKVVDGQLQEAVLLVPHEQGTVEVMHDDCTSEDLAKSLGNKTRIIVSTIQKFSFILDKVSPLSDKKFAIIIDECHSSTKGSYMSNVGKALSQEAVSEDEYDNPEEEINSIIEADIQRSHKHDNITLLGFSATPSKKTTELFGTKTYNDNGEVVSRPFTCYSMQQAIEEGFILDVLKNYTTYKTYFKTNKKIADNPEYKKKQIQKAVLKYANLRPENIEQKVEIILEHFLNKIEPQLDHSAKAMVVTDSREAAVRYKLAFDKLIIEQNIEGLKTLVAFTGGIRLKENDSVEYTEPKMNGIPEKNTKSTFNTAEYRILLVANKYQTGYDQPLLVAMYVDKQLKGAAAVQTLGRLNRTSPGKEDVFVLDFRNDYEDIKAAFAPYYTETELVGETDPNKLYELERFIDGFNLIDSIKIDEFVAISIKDNRTTTDVSKWNHILGTAKTKFNSINEEENKYKVRKDIIKLVEGYSWILQVTDFEDADLHKKVIFYKFFAKYLRTGDGETIDDTIKRLDTLFKQGLVDQSFKNKYIKKYIVNSYENLSTLPLRQYENAIRLADHLQDKYNYLFAFGSLGKGSLHSYSDIDLFLVSSFPFDEIINDIKDPFPKGEYIVQRNQIAIYIDGSLVEVNVIRELKEAELFYKKSEITDASKTILLGDEKLLENLNNLLESFQEDFTKEFQFTCSRLHYYAKSLVFVASKNDLYKYYFHNNIVIHEYLKLSYFMKGHKEFSYLPKFAYQYLTHEEWSRLLFTFDMDMINHTKVIQDMVDQIIDKANKYSF
jgi:type I restriction enzyme R subunit